MQLVNKGVTIAIETGGDCGRALQDAIDAHNAATQRTTNVAPEVLLLGRTRRRTLPVIGPTSEFVSGDDLRKRDAAIKQKSKVREDQKRRARATSIKIGSKVLLKRVAKAKDQTVFEPTHFEVLDGNHGDFVIQAPDGRRFKRNLSRRTANPPGTPKTRQQHRSQERKDRGAPRTASCTVSSL